ncbi:MFS general substrate transporter [Annulohypoxylon maeteangense]|uniref:MFS general substrate transporter n=1 Tax=Annulohypoxylon maeteangense TaxID=1927788 RepID=UPI0020082AEB|nr:MFS general substrate transporter [Annulohypoxylon maeteangense]KAI0884912.1 MFS general substrate transporter [Annulohypoxylon maeteangense]
MADAKGTVGSETEPHSNLSTHTLEPRPDGWIYKGFQVGRREIWYASPKMQLLMVALVCFLCPGMYNALSGLGGGGQVDGTVQDHASTALYSVFAVVAFFSGSFANKLGIKATLGIGGFGYCIYSASLLCYNHTKNVGFVIFAGALLGLCAGLLWTAQGAIMMAYPPEESKGRYISWFWIIFNLGAVIGSLIPLGQNVNNTGGTVTDGTYVGFIVLMVVGAAVTFLLVNADKVIRDDGSKVIVMKNPTWQSEFIGLWQCISLSPWVVALFPMFFSSNIFYTYQQNGLNLAHFNVRARSLNNLLYWLAQIFGAVIFGYALDYPKIRRSMRAKISFLALFALTFAIWGGGYAWQRQQVSREVTMEESYENEKIDWTDPKFLGPMFLYIFYGFYDACWQTCIYWYMGALSNSGRRTANMTGFYKGLQSAGAAVFWRLDGVHIEYNTLFAVTWAVCAGSLLVAAPIIFMKIEDTTSLETDLKYSDERPEDVVPTAALEEKRTDV